MAEGRGRESEVEGQRRKGRGRCLALRQLEDRRRVRAQVGGPMQTAEGA